MTTRLQSGMRVTARGRHWNVEAVQSHADCAAVRLAPIERGTPQARILLVPFDRLVPIPTHPSPIVVGPQRWAAGVLRLLSSSTRFGSLTSAANARIDGLSFQLEPALAMLRHGNPRLLIADDVGMGKTIQAGLVVAELVRQQEGCRVMVLTPAGLREQWREELRNRFGLEVVVADTSWLASSARALPPDVNPWSLPGIYLSSFDLVKRPEVLRSLEDLTWDLAVVDEAHACSVQTARRAGVHAVASRARRVVLLTATPPDGDPEQLAALRALGALPSDRPLVEFRRTRAGIQAATASRRSTLHHVRPSAAERRMHRLLDRYTSLIWKEAGGRHDQRARLAALVLRKRALSSPWSLAASLRRRKFLLVEPLSSEPEPLQLGLPLLDEEPLDDDAPDAVIAAAGLTDPLQERAFLERIERTAAQACRAESKLRFLLRLLRRAREPVIVFTEYRDTLQHLERALVASGHDPLALHGGLGPRERVDVQRAFNEGGNTLLATDAASEGLNLHHRCRTVVHFELPWTVSRLRQRTGRVDRLGQLRRVHEMLLVARHTAERMVLAPLVRRAQAAQRSGAPVDRLVETLTESTVGAAVIEHRPIVLPTETGQHPHAEFRTEARQELERIENERRGRARRGWTAAPPFRMLVRRSRREKGQFTMLVALRLEDDDGRVVHCSTTALILTCRTTRPPLTNADWRALALDLAIKHQSAWQSQALELVRSELVAAAGHHCAVAQAIALRDAAIQRAQVGVARQLVQASLFDTRAVRAFEARREAASLLSEEWLSRERLRARTVTLREAVTVLAIR